MENFKMSIIETFEAREGTRRAKLIAALPVGKLVDRAALIKKVYGTRAGTKMLNGLMMSLRGMKLTIEEKKLPYVVKLEDGKIGLFKK